MRNAEDLLHDRGVEVIHETVWFWWNRFDPAPLPDPCRVWKRRRTWHARIATSLDQTPKTKTVLDALNK